MRDWLSAILLAAMVVCGAVAFACFVYIIGILLMAFL
jgi:hypothetical protein